MRFWLKKIANINARSPWDDLDNQGDGFFSNKNFNKIKGFNFYNFQYSPFKVLALVMIVISVLWLATGIYIIQEGEEAIVMRFGKVVQKAYPGLNYHFPVIERAIVEKVNKSRRIEIGYRSQASQYSNRTNTTSGESIMLTGDENIIELNCDVMWHIKDLEKFTIQVANPQDTIKAVVGSAIREIIAQTPIAAVLSNQKQEIANQIQELGQKILDQYQLGAEIEQVQLLKAEPPSEVIDSYRDVQTARADKEREINQAHAYRNDILPRTRGKVLEILQEAESYNQRIRKEAEGNTKRFLANMNEYAKSPNAMKDRLSLETIEEVLGYGNKIITNSTILPHVGLNPKE